MTLTKLPSCLSELCQNHRMKSENFFRQPTVGRWWNKSKIHLQLKRIQTLGIRLATISERRPAGKPIRPDTLVISISDYIDFCPETLVIFPIILIFCPETLIIFLIILISIPLVFGCTPWLSRFIPISQIAAARFEVAEVSPLIVGVPSRWQI